jgi:hypothetical protein
MRMEHWFYALPLRLRSLFRRQRVEQDLDEELQYHLERKMEEYVAQGLTPRQSRQAALRAMDGLTQRKEECRDMRGVSAIENTLQDIRYSLRVLAKSPGFTVVAVLTLALAIGANAVVFGVLNGLVLRPLNVPQAQDLFMIEREKGNGNQSYPDYLDLRDRNRSFDGLAAYNIDQAGLDTGENPSRVWVEELSGNYFDVLRIQPYLGRFFHGGDEHGPNSAPYIVLTYAYWHVHFQDDRGVVGRTVQLNKHPFTIIGVALAVRGLARSLHSNFGFEPRNALLVNVMPSMAGYGGNAVPALQRRMIKAMESLPGVESVGLIDQPPLHAGAPGALVFSDETTDLRPSNAAARTFMYKISPDYFHAAGAAVLAGRTPSWHDDENSPQVAVVNREFASRIFGSATNALGRYYKMQDGTRIQVVGIVEDGKYFSLAEDPQPTMFLPILQSPSNDTWLVVRSNRDPRQLAPALRSALRDLDRGLPSYISTWDKELEFALFPARTATVSLGVLGAMGAMLSVTGIFGMAAYSVSRRLRELGIRVALGAQRKEVLQAALGRAFKLLVFGSAAGLLLGILASRVLAFIVYQATPGDPLVLAGVVLAMALLGLLATWIPAQRALSLDPMTLLREE